jgi:hypothetical protein
MREVDMAWNRGSYTVAGVPLNVLWWKGWLAAGINCIIIIIIILVITFMHGIHNYVP